MSVIPEHRPDKLIDARSAVELNNDKIAVVFFEVVRNRLQHVNSWPIIAENLSASFQLTNKEGIEVYRKAQEGDFVKIVVAITEPTSMSSSDWVRIQSLSELSDDGTESFGFTLGKSEGPVNGRKEGGPHSNEGICKFMVARTGNIVMASILEMDKATKHNHVDSRSSGASAAIGRFAHIDWQKMADGLISR